jgi:hypothetical protein
LENSKNWLDLNIVEEKGKGNEIEVQKMDKNLLL